MMMNRRMYINKQVPEKSAEIITVQESDELKKMIVDTLQLLSNNIIELRQNIDRLRQSLKDMEEKVVQLDSKQKQLEIHKESINAAEVHHSLLKLETETERIKKVLEEEKPDDVKQQVVRNDAAPEAPTYNFPMMPGTGFSVVTPSYLKNLKNQKT